VQPLKPDFSNFLHILYSGPTLQYQQMIRDYSNLFKVSWNLAQSRFQPKSREVREPQVEACKNAKYAIASNEAQAAHQAIKPSDTTFAVGGAIR
jgi:DNA topoisomerase IA